MTKLSSPDYPIHDLLRRRWSPRAFADRAIDLTTLARLFEAARWSASSFNEQPWAFLVATKDRPEEYAKALGCLVEFNQGWAKSAPVLVLTVAHATFERNGKPNAHSFHDVGSALAQLSFQAVSEGLQLHQMAGIVPDKVRVEYSLPTGWEPVTGVALGYPGDPATLAPELRQKELEPTTRKPLANIVFAGNFGTAFGFARR